MLFVSVCQQKSKAKSRERRNAYQKRLKNISHFYPCPKCEDGFLKLRHHLCPCDMEKIGQGVPKIRYGNVKNEFVKGSEE